MTVRGMSASYFAPLQIFRSFWTSIQTSSQILYAGIEGKRQYRFLERIA